MEVPPHGLGMLCSSAKGRGFFILDPTFALDSVFAPELETVPEVLDLIQLNSLDEATKQQPYAVIFFKNMNVVNVNAEGGVLK